MRVDFTEQMLNGRLFQTIGPMKEKGHIVTVHGIPFILQFGLKYFATVGFLQFLNFRCVFFLSFGLSSLVSATRWQNC